VSVTPDSIRGPGNTSKRAPKTGYDLRRHDGIRVINRVECTANFQLGKPYRKLEAA